jgi:anaerobic magnesium-protoporphyrin IX monomethyl ester cyclase
MTQILLGQSYYLRFDPKLWEAMQPYPPLGTLYAASTLRQRGYDVALFDAMLAESEAEWETALDRHQPKYAVIYEDNFNYLSKMCLLRMRQAAFTMIRMAKSCGCTVILCGADVTDHYDKYLEKGADFCLLGEGEETLTELLDHLSAGKATDSIPGLAARNAPHPLRRPDIADLDSLPFPAWDLVDIPNYRNLWLERHGYFSMNMVTTRGCPFHCNWCAKPIWGQRYHSRSPENVAAEMKWLKETYHPDHIWFADDIFGLKPGWLPRFGELVESHGASLPFKCLSRADLLTRPGEVEALKRAGAQTVWMGAESGSQAILDAMDKGTRVEQIREAARRLKAAGIRACFFLQFGYPGETLADIEKTLALVREADPDDIGISVSYPMPGTKFFETVRSELGEKQNWQDSADLAMLYYGSYPTGFYRQLHRVVHKEFRARKAWQRLETSFSLRLAARWLYNRLGLLFARWKLRRLAEHPNPILALPHLSHEQAASPTPQE